MAILLSSKLHRYPNRSSVKYAPVIRARRYAFKKLIAKRTSSSYRYCQFLPLLCHFLPPPFFLSLSFFSRQIGSDGFFFPFYQNVKQSTIIFAVQTRIENALLGIDELQWKRILVEIERDRESNSLCI